MRICQIKSRWIGEIIRLAEDAALSRWSAQDLIDEIANPESIMLAAISESNRVVGFVVGRIVPGTTDEVKDAEIYNIAVRAEQQRKGVGRLLLQCFLNECRKRNAQRVWLEVRASNDVAISFYKNNQFNPVDKRAGFYSDPVEDAIVMMFDGSKKG